MPELTINTHRSEKEIVDLIRSLGPILSGKKMDQHGLRNIFYGVLGHELFKRISHAYIQKAMGNRDDLGDSWSPLSKRTIKNRLSPKVLSRYPLSSQLLILRVSDALFASLSPGDFDGSNYHPVANQRFRYSLGKLQIGTMLEYASYAHAKRPLWPDDVTPWINEAISLAIEAVVQRLKEVL